MSLLVAESLTKRYGKKTVVDQVSLEVAKGEIVGLLGPNGAGKTTTFSMVMGLVRPDAGRIRFGDRDVTTMPVSRRARMGIGYLAQEPSVFRRLSVVKNVLAVLEWMPGLSAGERNDRAREVLEEMTILDLATQRADSLSGGERRRLEIARLLVADPELVLLDEPFAAVDPIAVEEIQKHVAKLRERGMAILITDHSVRETLSITDRSYIIHDGRILEEGTPRELVADERVRRAYLGTQFAMPELDAQGE
ncbi:MAG: LPS export ABC transporter ATP-binding protein [Planctomycetota bacterium]